ncbi:MAG: HU family DNA-binding protein [Gammaproteobacteria bacterium]|nr:HU family DNA-binding protein [Gammaproteobacteria bacterium]
MPAKSKPKKSASSKAKTTKTKKVSSSSKSVSPTLQFKAITQKQTKNQILRTISEVSELSIKQIKDVFIITSLLARCHLVKKGSGEFTLPEMGIKVVRKTKPATKKRQGRNPITGETITIAAKPKREIIKVRALKSLKDILE